MRILTHAGLLCALAVAWAAVSPVSSDAADSPERPNIVIILADDMGYSDLGCYGGEIRTPNIDGLADDGLRFTNFYNAARCWPTRACIMSGYYAQQVRMDPPKGRLPEWTRLMPHYLKPAGYRNYHSGKWHIRGAPDTIKDGGYDHSYVQHDHDRFFAPKRHTLDGEQLPPVAPDEHYYTTTAYTQYAIDFLKQHEAEHEGQPFLLYLAYTSPHFPLHAKPEDIARYKDRYQCGWDVIRRERFERMKKMGLVDCELSDREPETKPKWNFAPERLLEEIGPGEAPRAVAWDELTDEQKEFQARKMAIHAAMVDCIDQEVGRLIEQLKAMDAFENTIIFFLSDNGASAEQIIRGDMHDKNAPLGSGASYLCLGPGWSTTSNTPFRRHKHWAHEGGAATPLVVHWPKGIAARGELRREAVGHVVDLVPTAIELAGVEPAEQWNDQTPPPMPGVSLTPAFAADVPLDREYVYVSHSNNKALRMGDWKIVTAPDLDHWELFNLRDDRAETNDLSAEHPERVKTMVSRWEELDAQFKKEAGLK